MYSPPMLAAFLLRSGAGLVGDKQIMKTERVALYARVSTLAGQSPEMQLVELREYAIRRGWNVTEEYVDHGVSGAKESRPALNRLMADAKQRRFDLVAVWKIDRFGRSLKHLVNALAELESLGVAFVSLKDSLDLTTASGRLLFQLVAAMAEFERSLIQERVRAGIRNARAKGRRLGRPRLKVDHGRIARLRANGASLRAISEQLGISVGSVHRALRCSKNL
jgi:DNA invertase Pin-like site-specific DNA recombinase